MKLNVNEIFYSLQGEGKRAGEASIFIRLTQCNLACTFCDTDFAQGTDMDLDEILAVLKEYPCRWIIWTGGEPTLQLKDEHLLFFKGKGYKQAIETNGTNPVSPLIDYITCSPKHRYAKIKEYIPRVDEIRIPVKWGDSLPDIKILPIADSYLVSPIFDGDKIVRTNVEYCVHLVKENPVWALSLQIHKLIHIE
jgi:organic radical activating enzyme